MHGARIITRCAVTAVERGRVHLRDKLGETDLTINAANVINATGVWAGELADTVEVAPSKGSHVIVPAQRLGHPTAQLTVPARGGGAKYVFAIPTSEETVTIGLTDNEFDGPIPDCPVAEEWEIDLLLGTISRALDVPLARSDVIGSFAGLRPLLRPRGEQAGRTADVSREHQVIRDPSNGMLTIVGGKLTTYRKMAEDALAQVTDRPCPTANLPLVGATGSADPGLPPRLVRRFGSEAGRAAALAGGDPDLLAPHCEGTEISIAELRFCAAHELVTSNEDLLERRTRAGLTPALAEALAPAAADALAWAQESQTTNPEGAADGHAATPN
jgi:glycerol-3-phosphate dehydrogenase